MKIGSFNINDYLERLNEEAEAAEKSVINNSGDSKQGLIIPEENKKSFTWLKREYDKAKVEVKVDIKLGGSKFTPGFDMQTDLKSVKDFKPGMFGDVKTSDTPGNKKEGDSKVPSKVPDAEDSKGQKKMPDGKAEKAAEGSKKPEQEKNTIANKKPAITGSVKTAEDTDKKSSGNKEKKNFVKK